LNLGAHEYRVGMPTTTPRRSDNTGVCVCFVSNRINGRASLNMQSDIWREEQKWREGLPYCS